MPNVDRGIAWSTRLIRLSLFSQEAGAFETADLATLAGVEPETEEKRPKERFRRQTAPFHEGNLDLRASLLRADLFYLPQLQLAGSAPDFAVPLLPGLFEDRLQEVLSAAIINTIVNLETSIVRLALGAKLVAEHNSPRAACEYLKGQLCSVQVGAEMQDLLYRVNWRVTPNISGVEYINRLTTWSIGTARLVAITGAADPHAMPERYLTQLELDISTPADRLSNFSKTDRVELIGKLKELSIENVNSGEIK